MIDAVDNPRQVYDYLLDHCDGVANTISRLSIGPVWTVCQHDTGKHTFSGLAMSPGKAVRTLSWSGTLVNQSLKDICQWVTDWEPYKATVGMAALNCSLNIWHGAQDGVVLDVLPDKANLTVFEYFLPQLENKEVVVIGHYPGIEYYVEQYGWKVIERAPQLGDYPDPAAEFLLPKADWVFLSATTLINKTFPRLATLAQSAKTVLMGPTVPWVAGLRLFGIDYLAGVEVVNPLSLYQTACEGGGVRIFETGVRYKVMNLQPEVVNG